MMIIMCKSKISGAKITATKIHYEGSIEIDEALLLESGIIPGEKVEVLNLNNGSRIETYAISGKKNSGSVCLYGAAALSGKVGDEVIILAYGFIEEKEAKSVKIKLVKVDDKNRIKNK
ncbi:MAG: aspartate 1-decarboxylase [Candidatus Omnitrophica bacterium]|nr:aspartate 1-decarboxylase [Candidatus Omnitrophota bacterium]HOX54000.1 aspartate 1-decarboxylase [Candidatus Omnitrophota bacterium]